MPRSLQIALRAILVGVGLLAIAGTSRRPAIS